MAAIPHTIPELDRRGLRSFGLTTGVIVAVLFGVFFPWLLDHATPIWPWAMCGTLVLWALVAPASLRPLYRVWMRFGLLMSRITTPLILGIVFYVLITPVAILLSLLKRDAMARTLDSSVESYRVISRVSDKNNLEKPF